MTRAQGMAGIVSGVQASGGGGGFDQAGDGFIGETIRADAAGLVDIHEEGAGFALRGGQPVQDCAHRADGRLGCVGNGLDGTLPFLVCLAALDRDFQAFTDKQEVSHVKGDKFGAAEGAGETEKEEGFVTGAFCAGGQGGRLVALNVDGTRCAMRE